jgi:hypothetical protein
MNIKILWSYLTHSAFCPSWPDNKGELLALVASEMLTGKTCSAGVSIGGKLIYSEVRCTYCRDCTNTAIG